MHCAASSRRSGSSVSGCTSIATPPVLACVDVVGWTGEGAQLAHPGQQQVVDVFAETLIDPDRIRAVQRLLLTGRARRL